MNIHVFGFLRHDLIGFLLIIEEDFFESCHIIPGRDPEFVFRNNAHVFITAFVISEYDFTGSAIRKFYIAAIHGNSGSKQYRYSPNIVFEFLLDFIDRSHLSSVPSHSF